MLRQVSLVPGALVVFRAVEREGEDAGQSWRCTPDSYADLFSVWNAKKMDMVTVGTKMRSSISCYRTILILRSCFIEAHLRFRIFCLHTLKSECALVKIS